jgi:hypothetical protein
MRWPMEPESRLFSEWVPEPCLCSLPWAMSAVYKLVLKKMIEWENEESAWLCKGE